MSAVPPPEGPVSRRRRGQIWLITLGAIAAVVLLNMFAGRRDLGPMDFVVGGQDALQFCDPNHPRFLPSASSPAKPPVAMRVDVGAGSSAPARLRLITASGRTLRGSDLVPAAGGAVRLFVVGRSLATLDVKSPYESAPGEWTFVLVPRPEGGRVFADFTPKATEREMYARADLAPAPDEAARRNPAQRGGVGPLPVSAWPLDAWRFDFHAVPATLYSRQPFALSLKISRVDGAPVLLQPQGAAWAELLVFGTDLSGLAKFPSREHVAQPQPPDSLHPTLTFDLNLPNPGRYAMWAELHLGDRVVYPRFEVQVLP